MDLTLSNAGESVFQNFCIAGVGNEKFTFLCAYAYT